MISILARIGHYAAARPNEPALVDGNGVMSYAALQRELSRVVGLPGCRRVGLLMDNGSPWVVLDLALLYRGTVCVPMPLFFSDAQLRHVIDDAGLDMIITDDPERVEALVHMSLMMQLQIGGQRLACFGLRPVFANPLPPGTTKITYTSGTTGEPKGVCLSGNAVERVTLSLCRAVGADGSDRTLSLLPLSTLLENIGGVYTALASGACAQVPSLVEGGIGGTSVDTNPLLNLLQRYQPTSIILVPQLVKGAVVEAMESGARPPSSLRFAAVGGAPLSATLLEQARAMGLPVYQGYGLSEVASVISLNLPGADKPDSVGRPLPHVDVRIAADGEIIVQGDVFRGYLGQDLGRHDHHDQWATGDLGELDEDGFLHVTGRKKSAYATAYGRNIAPEWVESELAGHPAIAQAAVFGEARPFNVAVIVPRGVAALPHVDDAVTQVNQRLPEYARVSRWVIACEPFTAANGLGSPAGVVNRCAVEARYAVHLENSYAEQEVSYGVF